MHVQGQERKGKERRGQKDKRSNADNIGQTNANRVEINRNLLCELMQDEVSGWWVVGVGWWAVVRGRQISGVALQLQLCSVILCSI